MLLWFDCEEFSYILDPHGLHFTYILELSICCI